MPSQDSAVEDVWRKLKQQAAHQTRNSSASSKKAWWSKTYVQQNRRTNSADGVQELTAVGPRTTGTRNKTVPVPLQDSITQGNAGCTPQVGPSSRDMQVLMQTRNASVLHGESSGGMGIGGSAVGRRKLSAHVTADDTQIHSPMGWSHPEECKRVQSIKQVITLLQEHPEAAATLLPDCWAALQQRLPNSQGNGLETSDAVLRELWALIPHVLSTALLSYQRNQQAAWQGHTPSDSSPGAPAPQHPAALLQQCLQQLSELVQAQAAQQGADAKVLCALCLSVRQSAVVLADAVQPVSKQLVLELAPLLTHRKHQVRVSAVGAVGALVLHGAHEALLELTGFEDQNLVPIKTFYGKADIRINYFARLAQDASPQVRAGFLRTLQSWLVHLPQRREYDARLLPYVVSGLLDTQHYDDAQLGIARPLAELAWEVLNAAGRQYGKDEEQQLQDYELFLSGENDAQLTLVPLHVLQLLHNREQLQEPLKQWVPSCVPHRPTLSTRLLLQGTLGPLTGALAADLTSWQAGPQQRAAELLGCWAVLLEGDVAFHLQDILPAMCKVLSGAPSEQTRKALQHVACLLGCMAPLDDMLEVVLMLLEEELHSISGLSGGLHVRIALLRLLACAMEGAGVRRVGVRRDVVWQLLQQLLCTTTYASSSVLQQDGYAEALLHVAKHGLQLALPQHLDHQLQGCQPAASGKLGLDATTTTHTDKPHKDGRAHQSNEDDRPEATGALLQDMLLEPSVTAPLLHTLLLLRGLVQPAQADMVLELLAKAAGQSISSLLQVHAAAIIRSCCDLPPHYLQRHVPALTYLLQQVHIGDCPHSVVSACRQELQSLLLMCNMGYDDVPPPVHPTIAQLLESLEAKATCQH